MRLTSLNITTIEFIELEIMRPTSLNITATEVTELELMKLIY